MQVRGGQTVCKLGVANLQVEGVCKFEVEGMVAKLEVKHCCESKGWRWCESKRWKVV